MEEKKTITPIVAETPANEKEAKQKPTKVDAAQVQAVLKQAEGRMQQLVENIKQLDQMLRDKTIDQLFEVLKYSVHFEPEFVEKCAECIKTYLTNVAFGSEETVKETETKEEA